MRFLVVSDLHVSGTEDPVYRSLLSLLRERVKPGDTLVLAGDLFDLFVGTKQVFLERYQEFFDAVRDAGERGTRIHYIEGNHDFLIRRAFRGMKNVQLHPHDVTVEIEGKRFYVAHGDTVDRGDLGYLVLRAFLRSPVMKAFVACAPGKLIDRIGRSSSQRSRGKKPVLVSEFPVDRVESIRKAYRSFAAERLAEGYDFVVLGHCHDLDEMRFQIGGRSGQYVNVGYPRVHGSFLAWEPGEDRIHRTPMP